MTTPEHSNSANPDTARIGQAVIDVATAWDARMAQAMAMGSAIIAFRGAGSTGGIDAEAADNALNIVLAPRIEQILSERPVTVVCDGDTDNPDKPDNGYIVGRLRDKFDGRGVGFLAAQTHDWYSPPFPGANLVNAHELPYETFVFDRGRYRGDHNRFTQSDSLAAYHLYEQIYVGAAGTLAASQMVDYCRRIPPGKPARITLVRALINQTLDREIGMRLAEATEAKDRAKFEAMLEQRRQPYGKFWNNDGSLDAELMREARKRSDDTHELVVLWETLDKVDIVNCRKVNLNSHEFNAAFKAAPYFVKTRPIQARQVPAGRSETVIVNSGATRDTAEGGDWICVSAGTQGEYVVHASDFLDIYEPIADGSGWFAPRRDPRKLVQLDEDVVFMAPWGRLQAVQKGGYLIERRIRSGPRAGQIERYGSAKKDVELDYVPASSRP